MFPEIKTIYAMEILSRVSLAASNAYELLLESAVPVLKFGSSKQARYFTIEQANVLCKQPVLQELKR